MSRQFVQCFKYFLLVFLSFVAFAPETVSGQIAYKGHLSTLRIEELHKLADRMQKSINPNSYACESYYDYVCSLNRPLFSVLGHLPNLDEIIDLMTKLQNDNVQFEAKQKLMDFFVSCNVLKSMEDCYRETFAYFKPLFGYVINQFYIDSSSQERHIFLELLQRFIEKSENVENFHHNRIHSHLRKLREKFQSSRMYFRVTDLNHEYRPLLIYREGYQHNVRNLELHRRRNSTYEFGLQRTMLDWSLYVYQSRNKPMSYYFPTFSVHLWMTLYNSTERLRDVKSSQQIAECLQLPQFVNVLDEARMLAVIYLKSFRSAWQDFRDWITKSPINQEIFDDENDILKQYHMNNKRIFFTLYAQNFCDFGKELAENVFYLGLRQNQDFFSIYSCGYQTQMGIDCV